jgi:2-oxoglutarate dehydrogenase E2 component (dihydrolipoamide succinyltransferase)
MAAQFELPPLPLGGAQATVARWLKAIGDPVAPGEPLLIVVTGRAEIALPAPADGILAEVLAAEGATVPVGGALARLRPPELPPPGPRATPVARRVAAAHGVAIESLAGSGPGGRVLKRDVLAAAGLAGSDPGAGVGGPAARSAVAQPDSGKTEAPWHMPTFAVPPGWPAGARPVAIPRVVTATHVDLAAIAGGDPMATVAAAAVAALAAHPRLNAVWGGEAVIVRRRVQLGVVLPRGAALIHDAQELSPAGIARGLARAAPGASLAGATFLIAAISSDAPPLAAPPAGDLAAALLLGAARPRPLVIAGAIDRLAIRPIAWLALAYDARAVDQAEADAFLRKIRARLEA